MTDKKSIYKSARLLFNSGEYRSAFSTLSNCSPEDFYAFAVKTETDDAGKLLKSNWLLDRKSYNEFWSSFILNDLLFSSLLNSSISEELLNQYFVKLKVSVPEFESKLRELFPDKFIKAIRANQLFLDKSKIEHFSRLDFGELYSSHKSVWRILIDTEKLKWNDAEKAFKSIRNFNVSDILVSCTIWLENKRYSNDSAENTQFLSSVYGYFIDFLFSKDGLEQTEMLSENDFSLRFAELLKKSKNIGTIYYKVAIFLNKLSDWAQFKQNIVDLYSFDFSFEPVYLDGALILKSNASSRYHWAVNGVRYETTQHRNLLLGSDFVDELESKGILSIPKGKLIGDEEINRQIAIMQYGSIAFLNSL